MIEVNATVHYQLARPDDYLYRQLDGEATIRTAAESVLQSLVTTRPIDEILTVGREAIERQVLERLQQRLDRYEAGVRVVRVKLLDVHPSLEVVDAFRDVSGAFEEKNRLINEAEAYRNEQVALARGNAEARQLSAVGYSAGKKNRAAGDAARFEQAERAFRTAPGPTETRLYLEAIEQVLPGKRKLIVDSSKGRRHLLLIEEGVEIAPAAAPLISPPRPFSPEER
jgi:HflK protein